MRLEQDILVSFLLVTDCLYLIGKLIKENFTDNRHQVIFVAIKTLYEKHEAIDYHTVVNIIGEDEYGAYLMEIMQNNLTTVNVESSVNILLDNASRTKTKILLYEFVDKIDNKKNKLNDLIGEYQNKLCADDLDNSIINTSQLNKEFVTEFERRCKDDYSDIIKTDYDKLDEILYIRKGKLIVLAARPSTGKTTLGINIIENMARRHKTKAVVFSLEMDPDEIYERMISRNSQINYKSVQNPKLIPSIQIKRIISCMQRTKDLPIIFEKKASVTINEIMTTSRRLKAQNKIDIILIDYLQLIKPSLQYGNKNDKIGEMSRDLKLLSKELQIPILLIAQLNRDNIKEGKRPGLHNLRDSGEIEQNIDVAIFLHRENLKERMTDVIIAKNRQGEIGEFQLEFFGEYQHFRQDEKEVDNRGNNFK